MNPSALAETAFDANMTFAQALTEAVQVVGARDGGCEFTGQMEARELCYRDARW